MRFDTVLMPSTGGARTQFVAPLKLSQKSLFFFFFFFSFFVRLTFDVIRNAWCMIKLMANQYDKSDAMSMN